MLTKRQVQAFLAAVHTDSNRTLTWLESQLGRFELPGHPFDNDEHEFEKSKNLAALLREMANVLERSGNE